VGVVTLFGLLLQEAFNHACCVFIFFALIGGFKLKEDCTAVVNGYNKNNTKL
jgi:hypothetical protein